MLKSIYKEVSNKLNIPEEVVKLVYNSYWKFALNIIKELPLDKNLTEEEFNNLRRNINIPSLGKLHCNYNKWLIVKTKIKNKKWKNGKQD